MGSTWERSPDDECEAERLADEIRKEDCGQQDVEYHHCHSLGVETAEKLGPTDEEWAKAVEYDDGDQDKAAEFLREGYRDYIQGGNGYVG